MFLARNHVPYRWYDVERDAEGERLRALADASPAELPLVLVPDGETLRCPSTLDLAAALGLHTRAQQPLYDLCIVGGGPAGLAAAVYAASEGLSTVIVEREAPGGQAGQSAAIENYLGFPKGLSGSDLAQRAIAQVSRFGAEMVLARDVVDFETRGPVRAVLFDGHGAIESRALIVATGVSYRRLDAAGLHELTGRGIYYGIYVGEANQCQGDEVYIVGAANSAGQAALNLCRFAKRVVLVVRGTSLVETMSSYLVTRIMSAANITVHYHSEVVAVRGEGHLEALTLADGNRRHRGGSVELAVRLHRRVAPHRVAGHRHRPRRERVCRHWPRASQSQLRPAVATGAPTIRTRDERAGRLRGRRRSAQLDETGCVGRR